MGKLRKKWRNKYQTHKLIFSLWGFLIKGRTTIKRTIIVAVFMLLIAPCVTWASDYAKASEIQKVNLGNTFKEVSEKIGDPQQVLSKEFTDDGKEKVIWLYEAIDRPYKSGGFIQPASDAQLEMEKAYQLQRLNNPPYLIIFIEGKVKSIERMQ